MTKTNNTQFSRILSIAPSTKGFGFALLEGKEKLVEWGVKAVEGDKNAASLSKIAAMIDQWKPSVIVLEDCSTKDSRRAPRIRELSRKISELGNDRKLPVELLTREEVRATFFSDGPGTKQELAELLAKRFPEELGSRLPDKRLPWKSEDSRLYMFYAVALALAVR